jgi:hypothetical protein
LIEQRDAFKTSRCGSHNTPYHLLHCPALLFAVPLMLFRKFLAHIMRPIFYYTQLPLPYPCNFAKKCYFFNTNIFGGKIEKIFKKNIARGNNEQKV